MAVIFLKIKAKNPDVAVATASIFNADIRKKNNISLSSLFRQSSWLEGNLNIYSKFEKLGLTGIDRKEIRLVSMSEHDCSLRYQMMIKP